MKKLCSVILTILLTVGTIGLTACSSGDNGNENKIKTLGIDLTAEQYAIAVKKGDSELLNSINAFLNEKNDEIQSVLNKYLSSDADLTSSNFGANVQTKSTSRENELLVATELGFAPFEYTIGNKIAGIDMEIAQLLADYLGKTLVVVNMSFSAVVSSVANGSYDIAFAGLTITDERKESVDFSTPYFDATQTLILKADDETFASCKNKEDVESVLKTLSGNAAKCGGQIATTSYYYIHGDEAFEYEGFSNLIYNGYDDAALAVQDMLNGNIAFVVVDKATANALVKSFNE